MIIDILLSVLKWSTIICASLVIIITVVMLTFKALDLITGLIDRRR